jgi:hypothetical protein
VNCVGWRNIVQVTWVRETDDGGYYVATGYRQQIYTKGVCYVPDASRSSAPSKHRLHVAYVQHQDHHQPSPNMLTIQMP